MQKSAYELRISDSISDVCSSDLHLAIVSPCSPSRFSAWGRPSARPAPSRESIQADAMQKLDGQLITLLGGGGFLGRYVVQRLLARGARVRVAQREPREIGRAHV